MPLLALLRSTPLTEAQVAEIVRNIAEASAPADVDDPIERDDIAEFIAEVTEHDAARRTFSGWRPNWPPGLAVGGVDLEADAGPDSEGQ